MTREQKRIAEGCRCKACFGLAEYMILLVGKDFGLERAPGCHSSAARPLEDHCDGTFTCGCKRCTADRTAAAKRGPVRIPLPWEPRPSRRLIVAAQR
jgi:hypothetical protein